MFGGRGKCSSAFPEAVNYQVFCRGELMSPLFWADEESVLLCFPAAVGNTLSFVSCVFSALLSGRAGGLWEEALSSPVSQVQCQRRGRAEQPCWKS